MQTDDKYHIIYLISCKWASNEKHTKPKLPKFQIKLGVFFQLLQQFNCIIANHLPICSRYKIT